MSGTIDNTVLSLIFEYNGVGRVDGQAEFESEGAEPFGLRGDSGSLIVDADRRAIGLLFAVSDAGITSN